MNLFKQKLWLACFFLVGIAFAANLQALKFGESFYLKYENKYLTCVDNPLGKLPANSTVVGSSSPTPFWIYYSGGIPSFHLIRGWFGPISIANQIVFTDTPQPGSIWTILGNSMGVDVANVDYPNRAQQGITLQTCQLKNVYYQSFLRGNYASGDLFRDIALGCGKDYGAQNTGTTFQVTLKDGALQFFSPWYWKGWNQPLACNPIIFNNNSILSAGDHLALPYDQAIKFTVENIKPWVSSPELKDESIASLGRYGFKLVEGIKPVRVFAFDDASAPDKLHLFGLANGDDDFSGLIFKLNDDQNGFKLMPNKSPTDMNYGFGTAPAQFKCTEIDMRPNGDMVLSQGANWFLSFIPAKTSLTKLLQNSRLEHLTQNLLGPEVFGKTPAPYQGLGFSYDNLGELGYMAHAFIPRAEWLAPKERSIPRLEIIPNTKDWAGNSMGRQTSTVDTVKVELMDDKVTFKVTINNNEVKTITTRLRQNPPYAQEMEPALAFWIDKNGMIWNLANRGWAHYRHYSHDVTSPWTPSTYLPEDFNEMRQRTILFGPENKLYAIKLSQGMEKEILMHNGVIWQKLETPEAVAGISTDDEKNLYLLTVNNEIYSYINGTWNKMTLTGVNGFIAKFKVAGTANALKMVLIYADSSMAAGSGTSNSIGLKNYADLWGIKDATITGSGKMAVILGDVSQSNYGQVWLGSFSISQSTIVADEQAVV